MTNNNPFQEIDEDLSRQRLEAFWKRYGFWVIIAALGIVLATATSTAYQGWKAKSDQRVTSGFLQATTGSADPAQNIASLQKFADQNRSSNQGTLALLQAGSLAINQNNKSKAIEIFDSIASNTKADPAFRQLGTLLSVQAQLDDGDPVALSSRLQPLVDEDGAWHYSALEDQGYLALRAGDKSKAKQIFTDLSQDARAAKTIRTRASDVLYSLN